MTGRTDRPGGARDGYADFFFANAGEVAYVYPDIFAAARATSGLNTSIVQAQGGHPFADYAEKGLMQRAVELALGRSDGRCLGPERKL